ncbi:PD-(D/E)XK nuclease family protein [Bacillus sp. SN10]|uniref:PD-(D/E)XK nuclease family protein n=1 Tax=Bacillus sp. SN10 TaxID=2056493 RepID=UPI000C32F689|nr:PD-(D/E)XK nuclease family protein [Bacillus sp. SN10]PKJ52666.1 hypothetical protein CWE34_26460 [Bacillus sp. SN10]
MDTNLMFQPIQVLGKGKTVAMKPKAQETETPKRGNSELANRILDMFDKWHGHREIWDDQLDADIHRMEMEIRTTNRKRLPWGKKGTKYFSPSSANSDSRELYMKMLKEPRDQEDGKPHQGRWRRMGEAFGEMLQRDLLFIEKHWEKEFGEKPPFVPYYVEINGRRYPAWEKYAQEIKHVEHNGRTISILGQCDGILVDTSTGELIILEIKSKQTTSAQTGFYSMKEVGEDHERQTMLYSELYENYGISKAVVLYGNLARKSWNMEKEEYEANPDLRAFEVDLNDEERTAILNKFEKVLIAVDDQNPPKFDITKFTFNNYKEATVKSLTSEEYDEIFAQVERIKKSRMPQWKKNSVIKAWEYIEENWVDSRL